MSTGRSRDLRVLVACEFSGIVRDAFLERGHNAWSCDLLPSESLPQYHMRCDVFEAISRGPWDLMIAFPPCTHLASSGARWFKNKRAEQDRAIEFVINLWASPIPHFAIENPIGVLSTRIGKPDQIIQPWQFGHGETKATCLWLWNLPKLTQQMSSRGARDEFGRKRRGQIVGRIEVGRFQVSQQQWRTNGAGM